MDLDFSKVVLIVLAVLPGYLALRGNARIVPRMQKKKGATEEIAEFLIYSVIAHLILASFCIGIFFLAEAFRGSSFLRFREYLGLSPASLFRLLEGAPTAFYAIYLIFSLGVGYVLGLMRGLFDVWHLVDWLARKAGILNSRIGRFWFTRVERFLITGRPIIYDALFPEVDEEGRQKEVFVELVLKEGRGSITGRVTSFSIANDEESHKLLYLRDVYQKISQEINYRELKVDGLLIDMADAITVHIKQV
jgi:hypothetical protein